MKLIAQAYFNELDGPATVDSMTLGPHARLAGDTRMAAGWSGFQLGDPLKPSSWQFPVEGESIDDILNRVFEILNSDHRVNGQTERSLSVGDVVVLYEDALACEERPVLTYAVAGSGFEPVSLPI